MARQGSRCVNPISFTVLLGALCFIYIGSIGPYSSGILTTIQREFQLKSSEVALLFSVNDIVSLVAITPMAYMGATRHRPRIIGVSTLVYSVGLFLCALPQFTGHTTGTAEPNDLAITYVNTSEPEDIPFYQSTQLCEISVSNASTDASCSQEELDASGSQLNRATLYIVGQCLIGFGSSVIFTLGLSYMDDGVPSKSAASLYIASLFMVVSLSPIVAFALSGFVLTLHTDFYKIDVEELGYDDKDPRWIGAWWLGYLLYALLSALLSIPFFIFPQDWPNEDVDDEKPNRERIPSDRDVINHEEDAPPSAAFLVKQIKSSSSCWSFITGYFSAMRRIITNLTFMAVTIASIADGSMFAGFFSFIGRYLQTQYGVTPAMTSIYLGCATSPAMFFGNLLGGILIKKLNLDMKGLSRFVIVLSCITVVNSMMFFFVSCATSPIAGVNAPYPGGNLAVSSDESMPSCLNGCECSGGVYIPVCGADDITYVTPCHAGCTDVYQGEDGETTYMNCGCMGLASNSTTSEYYADNQNTAVPEKCSTNCEAKKYAFVLLIACLLGLYSVGNVPGFMLFLRCVQNSDKSIALGFSSLVGKVLAYIPAPIYFGAAIQTTCILFQEACGRTGNCYIYDNIRLTRVLFGLVAAFKVIALIMNLVTYLTIRRDEKGEYSATYLCQPEKKDKELVESAQELIKGDTDYKTPLYPYETQV